MPVEADKRAVPKNVLSCFGLVCVLCFAFGFGVCFGLLVVVAVWFALVWFAVLCHGFTRHTFASVVLFLLLSSNDGALNSFVLHFAVESSAVCRCTAVEWWDGELKCISVVLLS